MSGAVVAAEVVAASFGRGGGFVERDDASLSPEFLFFLRSNLFEPAEEALQIIDFGLFVQFGHRDDPALAVLAVVLSGRPFRAWRLASMRDLPLRFRLHLP